MIQINEAERLLEGDYAEADMPLVLQEATALAALANARLNRAATLSQHASAYTHILRTMFGNWLYENHPDAEQDAQKALREDFLETAIDRHAVGYLPERFTTYRDIDVLLAKIDQVVTDTLLEGIE